MAFDDGLAERVRDVLRGRRGSVREQHMFGGLAFMVEGNMAVGIIGDGLLVRTGKTGQDEALAKPHARSMQMGNRTMGGFVVVDPPGLAADEDLDGWIARGVEVATILPPK